jgi:hypothetical protein
LQPEDAQIKDSPARSVAGLRVFCLALALLPIVVMLGAVGLAKTNWFLRRSMPAYLQMMDAEWSSQGRSCDVLLFGDSAALTGLMPWIVEQESGLKTCSVAQTKGTVGVIGTQSLEQYLSQNPAPKVLVLAFAPEDWRPFHKWGEVAYVEGVLQMVRHGTAKQYVTALVTHPDEAFGFSTFVYKAVFGAIAGHPSMASGPVRDGHMTLPSPAEEQCASDPAHPGPMFPPDANYARQLRQRFAKNGTQVLLLVPPVPDCDPLADWYAQRLQGITDNPLERWPVGLYNDIDRHFTPAGAERFSREVGQRLRLAPGKAE